MILDAYYETTGIIKNLNDKARVDDLKAYADKLEDTTKGLLKVRNDTKADYDAKLNAYNNFANMGSEKRPSISDIAQGTYHYDTSGVATKDQSATGNKKATFTISNDDTLTADDIKYKTKKYTTAVSYMNSTAAQWDRDKPIYTVYI